MIVLRQKNFSWKNAVKKIEGEFVNKSAVDYEKFWAEKGRNSIAKAVKRARRNGATPEELAEIIKEEKLDLAKRNIAVGTSRDTSRAIANL